MWLQLAQATYTACNTCSRRVTSLTWTARSVPRQAKLERCKCGRQHSPPVGQAMLGSCPGCSLQDGQQKQMPRFPGTFGIVSSRSSGKLGTCGTSGGYAAPSCPSCSCSAVQCGSQALTVWWRSWIRDAAPAGSANWLHLRAGQISWPWLWSGGARLISPN
jgi:hypothetical protein